MKKNTHVPEGKLYQEWASDPAFVREYEKLEPEYQIAKAIIEARIRINITQKDLAKRIDTGQAVISRLESMRAKPSLSLIQRVADALGLKAKITFVKK